VGAALAAGCSVLVKAPEETPAAPAALVRAFADAGIPPGVLGLVYGNPAEISSYLIALAGQHMKRVTMELGGHAPVIVCEDAVNKGAMLLAGGLRVGERGNFWTPTVLDNVPLNAKVFNEEPFGPIAAIRPFSRLEDAIAEANRLPYGLAGYAFTRSLRNADVLARRVEVGMLWVNMPAMPSAEMPFGGIKDSGYGSEGGPEAIEAYLNVRSVSVANI